MRVAIYTRVSTKDQSCDLQVRDLKAYCTARKLAIFREYIDSGESGAKDSRPKLNELMAVAKRVFKRQHRAPGMPKQHHPVEMKMLSDLIEIGHFRFERNVFRLHVIGRAAAPALVVVNEMELVGEAVQLRQKIGDVEVWAPCRTIICAPRPTSRQYNPAP
jgi:Resolvase, N terminal domain